MSLFTWKPLQLYFMLVQQFFDLLGAAGGDRLLIRQPRLTVVQPFAEVFPCVEELKEDRR